MRGRPSVSLCRVRVRVRVRVIGEGEGKGEGEGEGEGDAPRRTRNGSLKCSLWSPISSAPPDGSTRKSYISVRPLATAAVVKGEEESGPAVGRVASYRRGGGRMGGGTS